MRRIISAVLIMLLMLTVVFSVAFANNRSVQLSSDDMAQLVAGDLWSCIGGTVGMGILGSLAGAPFGGVGAVVGGIGGILLGASTFCP